MSKGSDIVTAFFVGALLSCVLTFFVTAETSRTYWQTQAVRHNAAQWEVSDSGTATFKWKREAAQ